MAIRVLACTNPVGLSEKAYGALLAASKGLAMTAVDLLAGPSLLSEAKSEFEAGSDRTSLA